MGVHRWSAAFEQCHNLWQVFSPAPACIEITKVSVQLTLLLQRILQVEYEFPPHIKVSKECRDLLHKILVPDPAKRITVPEIQNHVWYKKDLPPVVAEMNDKLPPTVAGLHVSLSLLLPCCMLATVLHASWLRLLCFLLNGDV